MVLVDEKFYTDLDIVKYYDSMRNFQKWLLDDSYQMDNTVHMACKEVLEFLRLGTRTKQKKIYKDYFDQYDVEQLKQYKDMINNLDTIYIREEPIFHFKKKLIELGIFTFTNSYLENVISPHAEDKVETEYTTWLQGDVKNIIEQLKVEYTETTVSEALAKKFTKELQKLIGKKIIIKITDITSKSVVGIPLELTVNGYEEMRHPFLEISWEVSAPVENALFEIGEVVEAYYNESRNEYYRHLLIFVDFRNATPIANTLSDLLEVISRSIKNKALIKTLEIPKNPELIETHILKKIIERSEPLRSKAEEKLEGIYRNLEEIETKKRALKKERDNLDQATRRWKNIVEKINGFKRMEQVERVQQDYEIHKYEPSSFIKTLQTLIYKNNDQQLIYQENDLRTFTYALQANILTVLAGPSGTGKSSIVNAFANALRDVEVRMVPVQSSWVDTQDLIGYFHPTDKAFVPTPFMEAMVEAKRKENSHKIYLICLDEMNLAHVEYYFSEILSAREGDIPQIHLYPKRHWETARLIVEQGGVDIERMQSAIDLLENYPPVFEIPKNIRFIGTLNMDHTVKPLSPKVIDRSLIIELNHLKLQEKNEIVSSFKEIKGKVAMNFETFAEPKLNVEDINKYISQLQQISDLFEDFPNASLNSRGFKHLTVFLTYCQSESEAKDMIDILIYGKMLSRLEIKKSQFEQQQNKILEKLKIYPKSLNKIQKMLDSKHTITFW
ncbi:hypothetical protein CH76_09940 [Lysinibacillus sp. BF-4]|nr:hypothetical protein CH76_09940 [Lysinibacillus sp. BF-4]